jgi:predicted GNAT family N-acyltransferase
MSIKIEVLKVSPNSPDLEKAFDIRHQVFVLGQGCPAELERQQEEESHHFLAYAQGQPAGASRWRKTKDGIKLERFAVLDQYRGQGIGQALVTAVLNDLPADATYVYLHAQLPAVGLYEKFGFEKTGPEFEEAGIRHYKMVLKK